MGAWNVCQGHPVIIVHTQKVCQEQILCKVWHWQLSLLQKKHILQFSLHHAYQTVRKTIWVSSGQDFEELKR